MNDEIKQIDESMKTISLHPSLEAVVTEAGLKRDRLAVGLPMKDGRPDLGRREDIWITDGTREVIWTVDSLRALFRNEQQPPEMSSGPPPASYMPIFYFIEDHLLTFCDAFGDKTDQEFEKAFNNLRRRPDGAAPDELHHFLWQVGAGLVGRRDISAAEFEAVFSRLRRSARTFSIGPVSRNYIRILRQNFGTSGRSR